MVSMADLIEPARSLDGVDHPAEVKGPRVATPSGPPAWTATTCRVEPCPASTSTNMAVLVHACWPLQSSASSLGRPGCRESSREDRGKEAGWGRRHGNYSRVG